MAIWRFHAEAGHRLFFQLNNPGGGGMMSFMQRDGTLLLQAKNEFRGVDFPTAGPWYLVFWSLQKPLLQPLTLSIVDYPAPSD